MDAKAGTVTNNNSTTATTTMTPQQSEDHHAPQPDVTHIMNLKRQEFRVEIRRKTTAEKMHRKRAYLLHARQFEKCDAPQIIARLEEHKRARDEEGLLSDLNALAGNFLTPQQPEDLLIFEVALRTFTQTGLHKVLIEIAFDESGSGYVFGDAVRNAALVCVQNYTSHCGDVDPQIRVAHLFGEEPVLKAFMRALERERDVRIVCVIYNVLANLVCESLQIHNDLLSQYTLITQALTPIVIASQQRAQIDYDLLYAVTHLLENLFFHAPCDPHTDEVYLVASMCASLLSVSFDEWLPSCARILHYILERGDKYDACVLEHLEPHDRLKRMYMQLLNKDLDEAVAASLLSVFSHLTSHGDDMCVLAVKYNLDAIYAHLDSHSPNLRRLAAFLLSNVIVAKRPEVQAEAINQCAANVVVACLHQESDVTVAQELLVCLTNLTNTTSDASQVEYLISQGVHDVLCRFLARHSDAHLEAEVLREVIEALGVFLRHGEYFREKYPDTSENPIARMMEEYGYHSALGDLANKHTDADVQRLAAEIVDEYFLSGV